jgi:hypothetical protein
MSTRDEIDTWAEQMPSDVREISSWVSRMPDMPDTATRKQGERLVQKRLDFERDDREIQQNTTAMDAETQKAWDRWADSRISQYVGAYVHKQLELAVDVIGSETGLMNRQIDKTIKKLRSETDNRIRALEMQVAEFYGQIKVLLSERSAVAKSKLLLT